MAVQESEVTRRPHDSVKWALLYGAVHDLGVQSFPVNLMVILASSTLRSRLTPLRLYSRWQPLLTTVDCLPCECVAIA